MIDEVRELYRAYFKKLYMWQSGNIITVCWSRSEMPGYSRTFRQVNHKTSLAIDKQNGTIKFSSTTSPERDLW